MATTPVDNINVSPTCGNKIHYEKTEENILGRGGFAVVYKGTYNGEHQVAVKRVMTDNINKAYAYDRELDALQKLVHPNIVKLYHAQKDQYAGDDFRLFALELCAATLTDYRKKNYKGPMPTNIDALIQMASGLEYIHSKQMVHRDIKPDNILISKSSNNSVQMKLSDFGFCKMTDDEGRYSMKSGRVGTTNWHAPEIFLLRKDQLSTNDSDVFSLGCVFFYFLLGMHPFGKTWLIEENIRNGNPVNWFGKETDGVEFEIIGRMIHKIPEERIKLSEILQCLNRLSMSTSPVPSAARELNDEMSRVDSVSLSKSNHTSEPLVDLDSSTPHRYQQSDIEVSDNTLDEADDRHQLISADSQQLLIADTEHHMPEFNDLNEINFTTGDTAVDNSKNALTILPLSDPSLNDAQLWQDENGFAPFPGEELENQKKTSVEMMSRKQSTTMEAKTVTEGSEDNAMAEETQDTKKTEYFHRTKSPISTKTKPYGDFLIDRPIDGRKSDDVDLSTHRLINCLRYRLHLSPVSKQQTNDMNASNASSLNLSLEGKPTEQQSFYDALLRLVDDYDAAGRLEIFRLLLERRSAIPLFIPFSGTHHLNVFSYVTLPGIHIKLGEDKSRMRVAVVSCCSKSESTTPYLLKEVFHIDSIHHVDYTNSCLTSEEITAEIGCGFLENEKERGGAQPVLVLHVVGDFLPLWQFLVKFADYILVEDNPDGQRNFYDVVQATPEGQRVLNDINNMNGENDAAVPYLLLWKPSLKNKECIILPKEQHGFRHLLVECRNGTDTCTHLTPQLFEALNYYEQPSRTSQVMRKRLSEMVILKEYAFEAVKCTPTADIEKMIKNAISTPLWVIKISKMTLQLKFIEQAQYEEKKNENRLNDANVLEANRKIDWCLKWRRSKAKEVAKEPLIQLFFQFLSHVETHDRVLAIRKLEQILATRSASELSHLPKQIDKRYASYMESCDQSSSAIQQSKTKHTKSNESGKSLISAIKLEYSRKVLNVEHLWREVSHVYTSTSIKQRSQIIAKAPLLGAQHLLDGFSIELLDGDANMMHLEWITDVLRAVAQLIGKNNKERIFVLSVMGVQSSGKSTLLNTMFGIQMRTSVGQCTRGVNMQLIKVEGRHEYDYILLLDTEGCRATEFHGLSGSEKRDNQMATLNILLADATIVVIPGENDAAVKDILPIVLLAYKDSKLAESMGGRLSSMMFFVYNRVDTTQKDKFNSIIQVLGTSLHEAFDQVQKCTPASPRPKGDSPFRSFKLDTNSKESDVCVLGNVKASYEPPKDIPDAKYGDALKRFREHIHKRVTSTKNEVDVWKGRSILEFSEYLEEVWKCIGSANFSLTFTNIREHATFDLLDSAYKKIERRLNDAYYKAFQYVEREMLTQKKALVASANKADHGDQRLFGELKTTLENRIKEDIEKLNKETRDTVNQKGREKWSRQYENQWNLFKIKQAQDWEEKLEFKFANVFTYEKQLENYKIEMRQSIRDFFKNKGDRASSVTKAEQRKEFEEIYETFLARAKKNFPPKDIEKEIANVYINSSIIKGCQIDIISIKTNSETVIRCRKLKNKLQSNNFHDSKESKSLFKPSSIKTQHVLPPFKTQFNVNDRTTIKDNEDQCARSVYKHVVRLVADKRCYDNSIVQDVIEGTKTHIISHSLSVNSSFQFAHTFARFLATDLLSEIQSKWEKQNSPFEKFNSETNKKAMYEYFILVSKGCQTTRLFAAMMANTLNEVLLKAFEKKMIQITVNAIRNERWMHDARFMHKHIDLHLISLLEDNELDKVLNYLHKPAGIYDIVLKELIKPHIPVAAEIWQDFVKVFNVCIDNAFMLTANPSKMGNFMVV